MIKQFVNFPDRLYKGDDNFVPYMKNDLRKTLRKLLFEKRTYTALLACDNQTVVGRLLFTVDKNKQLNDEQCGYFCMFECVDNQRACNLLFDEMTTLLKAQGVNYISGAYFPFDQDNRRGILTQGFDRAPLIFTSYNKPYYAQLLTNYGFAKHFDTYEYKFDLDGVNYDKLHRLAQFSKNKFNFRVDTVNWKKVDQDVADLHQVMTLATTQDIYQDAPTIQSLQNIVRQWKTYLNKDFILIARDNQTNQPIGVAMALPDFFQVFRKMRGKLDLRGLFVFLKERKRIKSIRAMLQYVLPQYQKMGVATAMYDKMAQSAKRYGITYAEAGTIMENNVDSNESIKAIGGQLYRIYTIFYKQI